MKTEEVRGYAPEGESRLSEQPQELPHKQSYLDYDKPPTTLKYTPQEWNALDSATQKRNTRGADINDIETPARLKCDRCQSLRHQCIFPTMHNRGRVCGCCKMAAQACNNGERAAEPTGASDHPTMELPRRRSTGGDDDDDDPSGWMYQPQQVAA